jgi:hypothetical protein
MWSPKSLFGRETYETLDTYLFLTAYGELEAYPDAAEEKPRYFIPIHHSNIKMSRRKHVLEVRHDQQKFQQMVTEIDVSIISLFS